MLTKLSCLALVLAPLAIGCASGDGVGEPSTRATLEEADTAGNLGTYFLVTHADMRRCAWPTCGGVFVRRLNRSTTQCADGTYRNECRVLSEDLTAAGITGDDAAKITQTFEQGHVVLRGKLTTQKERGFEVPVLAAQEAWVANALSTPSGTFYLVQDNGTRCITYPCPSIDESKLDYATTQKISSVDLAASGANAKQVAAAVAALADPGVLVAGHHATIKGPGGKGLELVASEFYTRAPASAPLPPPSCGGFTGRLCPDGMACDVTMPNACGQADLMGTCIYVPVYCPFVIMPVCGCDGTTYANDCGRQRAGVQLAHAGAC